MLKTLTCIALNACVALVLLAVLGVYFTLESGVLWLTKGVLSEGRFPGIADVGTV